MGWVWWVLNWDFQPFGVYMESMDGKSGGYSGYSLVLLKLQLLGVYRGENACRLIIRLWV